VGDQVPEEETVPAEPGAGDEGEPSLRERGVEGSQVRVVDPGRRTVVGGVLGKLRRHDVVRVLAGRDQLAVEEETVIVVGEEADDGDRPPVPGPGLVGRRRGEEDHDVEGKDERDGGPRADRHPSPPGQERHREVAGGERAEEDEDRRVAGRHAPPALDGEPSEEGDREQPGGEGEDSGEDHGGHGTDHGGVA